MAEAGWNTWVWVRWKAGTPSSAWEQWKGNAKISHAWSTVGEWDCVFCLNTSNPDEVEQWVWKELRTNQWIENTQTAWVKQWW